MPYSRKKKACVGLENASEYNIFAYWSSQHMSNSSLGTGNEVITGNEVMDMFLSDADLQTVIGVGIAYLCVAFGGLLLVLLYRFHVLPNMELYEETQSTRDEKRELNSELSTGHGGSGEGDADVELEVPKNSALSDFRRRKSLLSSDTRGGTHGPDMSREELEVWAVGNESNTKRRGVRVMSSSPAAARKNLQTETSGAMTYLLPQGEPEPRPASTSKPQDDEEGGNSVDRHLNDDLSINCLGSSGDNSRSTLSSSETDASGSNIDGLGAGAKGTMSWMRTHKGMPPVVEKNLWRATFIRLVADTKNSARNMQTINAVLTVPISMQLSSPLVNVELARNQSRCVRAIVRRNRLHRLFAELFESAPVAARMPLASAHESLFFDPFGPSAAAAFLRHTAERCGGVHGNDSNSPSAVTLQQFSCNESLVVDADGTPRLERGGSQMPTPNQPVALPPHLNVGELAAPPAYSESIDGRLSFDLTARHANCELHAGIRNGWTGETALPSPSVVFSPLESFLLHQRASPGRINRAAQADSPSLTFLKNYAAHCPAAVLRFQQQNQFGNRFPYARQLVELQNATTSQEQSHDSANESGKKSQ